MNRREMLKLVGISVSTSLFTGNLPVIASTNIKDVKRITNRALRYKYYENYQKMFPDFLSDNVICPIAEKISLDLKLDLNAKFINKHFSLQKIKSIVFHCALYGDWFGEVITAPDYPKPLMWQQLPAHSMFRIYTTKGKVLEYQQSTNGYPDYESMLRYSIEESYGKHSTVVRFHPHQIVHIRVNCKKYHPYGTSCFEKESLTNEIVFGKPILSNKFTHDVTEGVKELVNRFHL